MFIQRYIVQKEIIKEIGKQEIFNLHQSISRIKNTCEFAKILKSKISVYNDDLTINNKEHFETHILKLTKEIFKYWFYSKVNTGDLDAAIKLEIVDRRESFVSDVGDDTKLMQMNEFFAN